MRLLEYLRETSAKKREVYEVHLVCTVVTHKKSSKRTWYGVLTLVNGMWKFLKVRTE